MARPGAPPLLSSFQPEALRAARDSAPELPRALLLDTLWPGCIEMAACARLRGDDHQPRADGRGAAGAHPRGRAARAGLHGQRRGRARELLAIGIDGIITDAVDRFSPRAALSLRRPTAAVTHAPAPAAPAALASLPSAASAPSGLGSTRTLTDRRQPRRHRRQQQAADAGERERRAQPDVLAEPAAEQRTGPGRQQDQPAHRAGHAAEQRLGRHRLAQARKLMKISTAPTPKRNSMKANAATPQRLAGATASSSQPPPHNADRQRQAGPRADAAAQAVAEHAGQHGADAHARRSTARSAARSGRACAWRTGSAPPSPPGGTSASTPTSSASATSRRCAGARSAGRRCRSRQKCASARGVATLAARACRAGSAPTTAASPRRPAAPAARRTA